MAKLRSAPHGRVGELASRRPLVLTFVATIVTLNTPITDLELQLRTQVRAPLDGLLFLSLVKQPWSVIMAAELLAEIGDRAR